MAATSPRRPRNGAHRNRILRSLPPPELRRIERDLEPVALEVKAVLHDVDVPIRDVYFVETGVLSVLVVTVDGAAIEVATVGREGFLGLPVALGTDRSSTHSVVQIPGWAQRMTAAAFRRHCSNSGKLGTLIDRYAQATFTMLAQSSACNRLHSIHERCARWLLTTRDRVGANKFPLTHEFLAQMLGVRRASVSVVLEELHREGLVEGRRGGISILAPRRLEREACECYWIINAEFDRLLQGKPSSPLLRRIRRRVSSGGRRPKTRTRPPNTDSRK